MKDTAVVLANGRYRTPNAKTAHGLVRSSSRFQVVSVVDPACAGQDAGQVLDGVHRDIPIVSSLDDALARSPERPTHCVVGMATHGGRFDDEVRDLLLQAARAGVAIVNGLHDYACDVPEIVAAVREHGTIIIDLRKPPPKDELHFWTGEIFNVRAPRIAVLGVDCAIGKRTTTRLLVDALNAADIKAEMIYTGQTGWMQGARYGFVLDSIANDYVSGELEHAIVFCDREVQPDVMILEGQSSLRNPSGPCGAEFLLSGAARGVILQHAPGREFFEGYKEQGLRLPPVKDEMALIEFYGARTLAVALHGEGLDSEALRTHQATLRTELGIPIVMPLEGGVAELVTVVRQFIDRERQ
ncbi:MAG: DUF1611 domain-containing protein [Gammaproteobacteria bacterium]|nr:DUF1611 domain-containing protein [Gammaproteobacteria bacterium]